MNDGSRRRVETLKSAGRCCRTGGNDYDRKVRNNMYKKLEDEAINAILEAGIDEFVENGLQGAAMSSIAKKSGVSVGVIYKYFKDKNTFFMSCLDHSLELLNDVLREAVAEATDLRDCIRKIVAALISNSKIHSSYNAMYNEITSGSCRKQARSLVDRIEGRSAEAYRNLIKQAQENGQITTETDAGILAFFFDNMLMMLQFSYSCDYYRDRMKLFCGDAAEDENIMADSLIRFLEAALQMEPINQ